jgi:hypothetical protein
MKTTLPRLPTSPGAAWRCAAPHYCCTTLRTTTYACARITDAYAQDCCASARSQEVPTVMLRAAVA